VYCAINLGDKKKDPPGCADLKGSVASSVITNITNFD